MTTDSPHPGFFLKLLVAVLSLVVALLMLELLIRLTDPLGITRYFRNSERIVFRKDDELGYKLEPGSYTFIGWSLTVLDDGTRYVPAVQANSDCIIVTLGDSVTFGQGVSDHETWVNRLAQRFPEVHFINAGVSGYNLPNIFPNYLRYRQQADGILYTLIDNDIEASISRDEPFGASIIEQSVLLLYLHALSLPRPPLMPQSDYLPYLDALSTDPHVLISAFASGGASESLAKSYPTISLQPMWTHTLSPFDQHPSAQGHEEIAQTAAPLAAQLIEQVCPDS